MSALYALYQLFAVLFGLVIGSFWNVAIARWPHDRSVVAPRSACPSCGTPVAAHDNIPLLSWLLLRARCRSCGWPIPATYPLTELLGGLLALLLFWRFVPEPGALRPVNLAAAALYFVFVSGLAIGAYVDLRHKILPDQVTLGLIPVGLLGCAALEGLGYTGWLAIGLRGSALGALAGGGFFGALALAGYAMTGREALGIGDVKMLAMIGAFLGPHPAIFLITLGASLTGSLIALLSTLSSRRRTFLPFGPLLALFALLYLLYGDLR